MNALHTLFVGMFAVMIFAIVYVKTGQVGQNGGTETAQIVDSLSGGVGNTIKNLEGG